MNPIQQVELPQLARLKGYLASNDVSSIDELSGRTTGRLGDIRPDTAHAIRGTAELALRYTIISAFTAGSKHHSVMTTGRQGAAGAWATPRLPGTTDRQGAADANADSAEAAVPSEGLLAGQRHRRTMPNTQRHADDSNTRPFWSGPTRQSNARALYAKV